MNIENMIRVKQTEINRCEIVVDFNEVSLDKPVSIHAYMKYNDEPFMLLKRNINPQEIINNKTIISMPSFGKYNIKISDLEENRILYEDVVPVKASRYIIAPLASSTPTLLFMLYYFSDMPVKTKEGDPVPVIITLSRNNHVDYRFLPENMYLNPYITQKDYEIESKRKWPGLETHEYKICYFLNELKEIDNDSSFIFYLNDMDPHLKKDVLGRNVESIFLMDGHMTLLKLKKHFMDGYKSWFNAIDMWLHKGISETCNKYQVELNLLKLLSSNKNQWWIIQKDKLPYRSIIDRYLFRHKKQIINPSVPDMIKKVKKAGNWDSLLKLFGLQELEKEIKALIEKEKTPAFLIGMRCEGDKFVFNEYEKALICLLGDSYEYFYKFHPAVKVEKLTVDDLSVPLKIIPNTAPYELLIPEDRPCIVAGPNSSLFLTTGNTHQHICFGFSRSNADKSNPVFGYVSIIDVFISDPAMDIKNGKYVPEEIKNLVSLKNKCILLEFVHEIEYEIGLYDQIDNKIEFYKWEDGQYRIVETVHR